MTKRGPGRPKSEEEKRDAGIRVMLTQDEMAAFAAIADAESKTLSTLGRELVCERLQKGLDRTVKSEVKHHVMAAYCKTLSDSLRESGVSAIMKADEIRRLRELVDALKESTGRTGFVVDRSGKSGSVIICGPTDDEITMCALVYTAAKQLIKDEGGEE